MIESTAEIKVNITRRFDGSCKVYAFDVRIDDQIHREVSKHRAFMLVIQAQEVAEETDMMCNVYGLNYLRVA
ncbi:hypothetical protein [Shinella sp. M31]|uniref:hypothetical protein n=1 Tax=Shinella sp. M31 TaxID=3368615 RepID=UPI003BA059EE